MDSYNKILVIKLRAIGDVLLSTIVINNLRSAFPEAPIDFLTEKAGSKIVLGNPALNKVHILTKDKNKSGFGRFLDDVAFIRNIQKEKYDLVFDFFGNPRSAILTLLSHADIRVGYDYRFRQIAYNRVVKSRASEIHEALWHLDALQHLDIPISDKNLNFFIDESSTGFANQFWKQEQFENKPVVGINFSGGWPAKKWPVDRFAQLVDRIKKDYETEVLVFWGPGEKGEALKLAQLTNHKTILIPETDLKQLGAILKKIDMLVTTDSGPMHIAAAVNTPCVAIYGPTNFRLQGPYGTGHEIVYKDKLDCLGCNRLDCEHTTCMNALSVDRVYKSVKDCFVKNGIL